MNKFLDNLFENSLVDKIELDKSICGQNYKDFKKTDKGQKMIEKYLNRWDSLGFTEEFPNERKEELAYAFEQLAVYLFTLDPNSENKEYYESTNFETVGFPLLRYTIGKLGANVFDLNKFLEYYKFFDGNNLYELIKGIGFYTIDDEVETCAVMSDMIVEAFNNPNVNLKDIKEKEYSRIKELRRNN